MKNAKELTRTFVRIQYNREWRGRSVGKPKAGTPGIYGLVDPRDPHRIRYVGSSENIEHRLYAHCHSNNPTDRHPRGCWLRTLRADGLKPEALVLEMRDVGATGSVNRHNAEGAWIANLVAQGQADLNAKLVSGRVSRQALIAENEALKAEVALLRAELAALRQVEDLV